MAQTLSLIREVRVFPCPNCGQTINTAAEVCPFCNVTINHAAAELAAAETSRVSQAVSDASYLRILAGTALSFIFLRFVPFIGLIGIFGFAFLEIALPILIVRWWIRFYGLRTTDPDFPRAKKRVLLVSTGVALFFLLRLTGVVQIRPF